MLKRLRIKFVCITMAIVTLTLCLIFGFVYQFTQHNLERESIQMMETISSLPSQLSAPNKPPREVRLPYFVIQISEEGLPTDWEGGYYDLTDEAFLKDIANTAIASGERIGIIEEYNLRFYIEETSRDHRIIFSDISSERHTLNNLIRTCAVIGSASFLVFLGISLLLARWAVKPVEKAWDQQRQFVADASHELKTPLTVILTNAELLQEPGIREDEKQQSSISILHMARRMRELVESLLNLARVDNGIDKSQMERLELSQLVSDAALPFEPVFFERGLGLDCQIEPGIFIQGVASRLQQVEEILLDNALKYSLPGSTVQVSLKRLRNVCQLAVASHGEPIEPEDLKKIFERFYRADKVRTANHSYGLGLAIAQAIVQEHRGKIWAESKADVNTFFVELPVKQNLDQLKKYSAK